MTTSRSNMQASYSSSSEPLSDEESTNYSHSIEIMKHSRKKLFGHKLSVVTIDKEEYLIGVQIATVLQRETFNMYRSMKIKQIDLVRASPEQVDYLVRVRAVRCGTHSVTLVPYEQGVRYVSDSREKQQKIERCGFSKLRTKSWTSTPIPPSPHAFSTSAFMSSAPTISSDTDAKRIPSHSQITSDPSFSYHGIPTHPTTVTGFVTPLSIPPISSLLSAPDNTSSKYQETAPVLPSIRTLTEQIYLYQDHRAFL